MALSLRKNSNPNFLSIFYYKPPSEYRKFILSFGNKLRISDYDILFKKRYEPHFATKKVSANVKNASGQPPTYTRKNEQNENTRGKVYRKRWLKS